MNHAIHTSDMRHAEKLWLMMGGLIQNVRRTGEKFFIHPNFLTPLRSNGRRKDTPAKLTSRLNQIQRAVAANDPKWNTHQSHKTPPVGKFPRVD